MFNSLSASSPFFRVLMTFSNNLDPDEAPQNVGPHLGSKLFDSHDNISAKLWTETVNFCTILKKEIIEKIYSAC